MKLLKHVFLTGNLSLVLLASLIPLFSNAHAIVYNKYQLHFEKTAGWQLDVIIKTAALRNHLLKHHPELQSTHLNTLDFQSLAMEYLANNIAFEANDVSFQMSGNTISFGGHETVASFFLKNMPEDIDGFDVSNTCLTDCTEQIINEFRVWNGYNIRSFNFTDKITEAHFNLGSLDFSVTRREQSQNSFIFLYIIIAIIILHATVVGICLWKKHTAET